jgi:hypothetical protein
MMILVPLIDLKFVNERAAVLNELKIHGTSLDGAKRNPRP